MNRAATSTNLGAPSLARFCFCAKGGMSTLLIVPFISGEAKDLHFMLTLQVKLVFGTTRSLSTQNAFLRCATAGFRFISIQATIYGQFTEDSCVLLVDLVVY